MIKDSSFPTRENEKPDEKYFNEDYITRMMEAEDRGELKIIQNIHNISDEKIELYVSFAKARKNALEEMEHEKEERLKNDPKAGPEEMGLGAYREKIEPQVREAVFELRKKGYNTFESGFKDYDSQNIGFESGYLKNFKASDELTNDLKKNGAELIIEPDSLEIKFSRFVEMDKVKEIWDKIADEVPDLGKEAEAPSIGSAVSF